MRFKPSAAHALRKLPADVQRRLIAAAEDLADTPRPAGVVKLEGMADLYRVRVGDYRLIYQVRDRELLVLVLRAAHRRDVVPLRVRDARRRVHVR